MASMLAAASCSSLGGRRLHVERVWEDAKNASGPSHAPLDVIDGDLLLLGADGLKRIDPRTGTARWRTVLTGIYLPADAPGGDVLVVEIGDDGTAFSTHDTATSVARVRVADGAITGRSPVALDENHGLAFLRRDDSLYALDDGLAARLDDGKPRWSIKDAQEFHQLTTRDALWVYCSEGLCGHAFEDGRRIGALHVPPGWAAGHRNGDLVVTIGNKLTAHDAATLATRWQHAHPGFVFGKVVASERWIAAIAQEEGVVDGVHELTVHRASDGAVVWRRATKRGRYLEYLAADGDLVAFFDSGDSSIHAVHLPDGAEAVVEKMSGRFVLSTDASGMAPAVPDQAPMIRHGHIFIQNWIWSVYRVTAP